MKKGFSLIETLVVVALFAFIGIVVSQSTAVSLTGSRKAEASTRVRENLNSALGVIERQLRSAKSISSCTNTRVDFINEDGASSTISCNPSSNCTSTTQTYVYLNSSTFRLTNTDSVCLTECQFTCTQASANVPYSVNVVLEGRSKNEIGVEDTTIRTGTSVNLRAY